MDFADNPERMHLADFGFRTRERFFYEYAFGESYEGISLQFLVSRYPSVTGYVTLIYAGYSNWNWVQADPIARGCAAGYKSAKSSYLKISTI